MSIFDYQQALSYSVQKAVRKENLGLKRKYSLQINFEDLLLSRPLNTKLGKKVIREFQDGFTVQVNDEIYEYKIKAEANFVENFVTFNIERVYHA